MNQNNIIVFLMSTCNIVQAISNRILTILSTRHNIFKFSNPKLLCICPQNIVPSV